MLQMDFYPASPHFLPYLALKGYPVDTLVGYFLYLSIPNELWWKNLFLLTRSPTGFKGFIYIRWSLFWFEIFYFPPCRIVQPHEKNFAKIYLIFEIGKSLCRKYNNGA